MKRIIAVVALSAGLAGTAVAAEFQSIGSMGMGGAGVARDMGAYAPYWNPAGLGFATKSFSATLGGGAGVRVSEGLADNVDKISKFTEKDDLGNSTFDSLRNINTSASNPKVVGDIVNLLTVIKDLETQKGTLSLNADAALGFQVKQFGIGLFMLSEGYGKTMADLENILPESSSGSSITAANLSSLAGTGNATQTFFSASQVAQLQNTLANLGINGTAQTEIINAFGNSLSTGKDPNLPTITSDQAVDTFTNTVAPALDPANYDPAKNINNNQTAVMVKNFLYSEIPISYGHAFDLKTYGRLAVGGSFKVVNGRVYQTRIRLTGNGESVTSDDVADGLKDNYEESVNVTVDLGTQWKYAEWLALGLVLKNLTSPAFKSPELKDQKGAKVMPDGSPGTYREGDVKLKPQARFGLALTPFSWLSLAGDIDLTENDTVLSGLDFKSRNAGGGLELSPVTWFKLRGGMYRNLASSEIGPVATAGLTIGIPWVLLEVDGAYGLKEAKYKNKDYPRESRLQAQLVVQF